MHSVQDHNKLLLKELNARLSDLNPINILDRGYSITRHGQASLKSIQGLKKDDIINTIFIDGQLTSKITDLKVQSVFESV